MDPGYDESGKMIPRFAIAAVYPQRLLRLMKGIHRITEYEKISE
jgi:hypothetical protein